MTDLQSLMLAAFQSLSEAEQKEQVMLAANAHFVIRMCKSFQGTTEVDKAVKTLLAALTRGIPSLGGEDLTLPL